MATWMRSSLRFTRGEAIDSNTARETRTSHSMQRTAV